jgi:SAM-dependent methyltransferase
MGMSMSDEPGLAERREAPRSGAAPAVDFLAALAGGGPVLELAIGTGRVALPLAARGLRVQGVEGSPETAARLRAKPGGADIPVIVGDLADVDVRDRFALAYLVFNSLFTVVDPDRQAACFRAVARLLAPGDRRRGVVAAAALRPGRADVRPARAGLRSRRSAPQAVRHAVSVAGADRPARRAGRPAPAGPLRRLAPAPVRRGQHRPRLGLPGRTVLNPVLAITQRGHSEPGANLAVY